MYDRLSLRMLLEGAGFLDVRQADHDSSGIQGWSEYDFDRSNIGRLSSRSIGLYGGQEA